MSLVAKIYHPSPISNWFAQRHNKSIDKIINDANQHLNCNVPLHETSTHRGLIKASAVYAMLKHLGYLNSDNNWFSNTYASNYISKSELHGAFDEWLFKNTESISEEAMGCLIAGALDISCRTYHEHEFLKPFIQASRNREEVKTHKKWIAQWIPTVNETKEIAGNIARCWQVVSSKPDNQHAPIPNPTYDLSNRIGGAQADLIVNRTVVSVVTNTQFTQQNFHELIAYVLLDTNDTYSIQRLVWVFPLRQTSIVITIPELFRNLKKTRDEFKQMVEENYPLDEFNSSGDGADLSKYTSKYC